MVRVAIIGAAGRMGRELVRAAAHSEGVSLAAAVVSQTSPELGRDVGTLVGLDATGMFTTHELPAALAQADVAIDFSSAEATASNLSECVKAGKPLLIGTTGFADLQSQLDLAQRQIAVLVAPNTSVGVTLLIELVRQAAAALPVDFDIEIIEAHHRMKRDAPSGTALALGRAAAEGRDQDPDPQRTLDRSGPREPGQIGFAAVRGGDIVGEHTVLFAGPGERLSLSHQATERAVFARGALQAAAWLASRPPGRYTMRDFVSDKSVA